MPSHLHQQLQELAQPECVSIICGINRGIEKESLRIDPDGNLAQTPHPSALGSALTHSSITTDYSESLMEFITPVNSSIEQSLNILADIHTFVYQNLGDEVLWAASMPCIVSGDESIPVAQYGSSNVAQMKTVYRYGLGHRYGRLMQAISGIHYNFSMPAEYWQMVWDKAGQPGELSDFITEKYLGLIRNFQRHSWLLVYLFGASPAVCASFLRGNTDHQLQAFDDKSRSLYLPYATALRMGDLGYNSSAQKDIKACYNSLDNYIDALHEAILQPHSAYTDISSGQNGNYQQLNDSLLQIENEFYSPIRPKRVAYSGETPLSALRRDGIEYIEVRCVDVSPFHPVGLDAPQIRFMDTFLLYCLLDESPDCDEQEQETQAHNLEAVVNRGRQPGLMLQTNNGEQSLQDIANGLLDDMQAVAALQNTACATELYVASLEEQRAKVQDPELTPSARILREMKEKNLPFFPLAMEYSKKWAQYFKDRKLSPEVQQRFEQESLTSLAEQKTIESNDDMDFAQYLSKFYAQYEIL